MVHALTTHPTNPKFGKAIILKLSQKTTPQVTRPVVVAVHIRANKIHVRNKKLTTNNPASSQIVRPHPAIKRPKTSNPKPQHPTKQTTPPAYPYKANNISTNVSKPKSP